MSPLLDLPSRARLLMIYNSYNNIPSEVSIKAGVDSTVSQVRTVEARRIFNDSFCNNLSALNGALFSEIYSRYLELHRKLPRYI